MLQFVNSESKPWFPQTSRSLLTQKLKGLAMMTDVMFGGKKGIFQTWEHSHIWEGDSAICVTCGPEGTGTVYKMDGITKKELYVESQDISWEVKDWFEFQKNCTESWRCVSKLAYRLCWVRLVLSGENGSKFQQTILKSWWKDNQKHLAKDMRLKKEFYKMLRTF